MNFFSFLKSVLNLLGSGGLLLLSVLLLLILLGTYKFVKDWLPW